MNSSTPFQRRSIVSSLYASIQDWIRKEIVDDDPCDTETFFPEEGSLEANSVFAARRLSRCKHSDSK